MAGISYVTDGWRGRLAEEFTFAGVAVVAQAVAAYLAEEREGQRGVLIGYDNRFMGPLFAERVAEVLAGNSIPALLLAHPADRAEVEAESVRHGLAGGVLLTVSEQREHGGMLFWPRRDGAFVNAVLWHVGEIEAKRSEVRVLPYARAVRTGMIRLTELGGFDGTGQFSYNAC